MIVLQRKIRLVILLFSILLSGSIYLFVNANYSHNLITIRLTQYYALLSLLFIYLALLATPLFTVFPNLPFRPTYILARKSLGISAFWFALLHSNIAFFLQLQGFNGLGFLSNKYLIAIGISSAALIILTVMAVTSLDRIIVKLGNKKWKMIHRFIYLAGMLILIHALMLGTHFSDLSQLIPQLTIAFVSLLLLLEAVRFDIYLNQKFPHTSLPKFGLSFIIIVIIISITSFLSFAPSGLSSSLGIHAQHQKLAELALTGNTNNTNIKIPGLNGDRNKRYTVQLDIKDTKDPLTKDLRFTVLDASNGQPATIFQIFNEKISHLIIVDTGLNYFDHIHPEQDGNSFVITAKFPKENTFKAYIDFQPLGAIEQQFAFTIPIGSTPSNLTANQTPDIDLKKTFGNYSISLSSSAPLTAKELSLGKVALKFNIRSTDNQPITNLKPYLGSFGHLVMINQKTYEYYHVHPADLTTPQPSQSGGPDVEFLPIGIYGPFKPGPYRIFAQFNHDGNILVSDYTLEVK